MDLIWGTLSRLHNTKCCVKSVNLMSCDNKLSAVSTLECMVQVISGIFQFQKCHWLQVRARQVCSLL